VGARTSVGVEPEPRPATAVPMATPPQPPIGYARVAPVLAQRCVKCHTARGLMGPAPEGFRLDSYAATIAAEDRVRVLPGEPLGSELVRRIKGYSSPRMPFDGPPWLSDDE